MRQRHASARAEGREIGSSVHGVEDNSLGHFGVMHACCRKFV
jgi:hypothetical protein